MIDREKKQHMLYRSMERLQEVKDAMEEHEDDNPFSDSLPRYSIVVLDSDEDISIMAWAEDIEDAFKAANMICSAGDRYCVFDMVTQEEMRYPQPQPNERVH